MRAGRQRRRRARRYPVPVQIHLVATREDRAVSKEIDHAGWRAGRHGHGSSDRDRLPEHRRIRRQLDGCGRHLRSLSEGKAGGTGEVTSGSEHRLGAGGIDFDNRLVVLVAGVQVAVTVDRQADQVVKQPARGVYALHPGRRHLDDAADVGPIDLADIEIVVGIEGQHPGVGDIAALGEHALHPAGGYLDDAVRRPLIIGSIQVAVAVESQSYGNTEIPIRRERALHPGGGHLDNLFSYCIIEVVVVIADQTVGDVAGIRDENRLSAIRADLDDLFVNIGCIQVAAAVDRQADGR